MALHLKIIFFKQIVVIAENLVSQFSQLVMFALEDVGLAIETLLQVGETIVGYGVDYVKKYRINYR